jgi:hypothetical protein
MSGTEIVETIFSAGQNEGIERSILPLPQLSYVQNARQRKSGRWGKRFGTNVLPFQNASGVLLGNGIGNIRSVGLGFAIVDDQYVKWDQAISSWPDRRLLAPSTSGAATAVCNPRIPGVVSGWLPEASFFPVPPYSEQNQQLTGCAQCFGLGYLWSAISFFDPAHLTDGAIRVIATNPTDQTVVFQQDFFASVAGQGGLLFPRLVVSTNIVLTYVSRPTNAARSVNGCVLTSLATRFGAEVQLSTGIDANGVYDACSLNSTNILVTASSAASAVVAVLTCSSTTLASTGASSFTNANNVTFSSCVTNGVIIYLSLIDSANHNRVAVIGVGGFTLVGSVSLPIPTNGSGIFSTILPSGGGVRAVVTSSAFPLFMWTADVAITATLVSTKAPIQYRAAPITRPFTIGTQVYVWCLGDSQFPVLLRLPAIAEYLGTMPTTNNPELCCPVEMAPTDFQVSFLSAGIGVDQRGLPNVTRIGTTASYTAMIPTAFFKPVSGIPSTEFRVIQARHYSDTPASRSVQPIYADDGAIFMPGGALTRIDERNAVEEGFILTPSIVSATPGGGGGLTASTTYQYVAVYRAIGTKGRIELSGTSAVASVTLGAGQTSVVLSFGCLDLGARQDVQILIFRTLSNQSIFHLATVIAGGPDSASSGQVSFTDLFSDANIAGQQVLYTQVGQALANGVPPPARFGIIGGQRLWLGGLLRRDVIECSKLIFGDQSPTFAASADQFSIVLPADVTGLAWMDNLVVFTTEGIYVVSGDGPDDSGNGSFSPPNRLPFALGCIEPRSVVTVDEGTFFQTARGLYLLPRGFGAPVPAGDVVMDTLATYPIITGNVVTTKATEQTIRWSCVDQANPTIGALIVYDLAHRTWSVDLITDLVFGSPVPSYYISIGNWFGGECILAEPQAGNGGLVPVLKASNSGFNDCGSGIQQILRTGDMRPFGNLSEGVLSKVTLMSELRAPCTLNVTKTTDWGSSPTSSVVFTGANPSVGQLAYTEAELGMAELRDAVALRVQWDENSTTEGVAMIAMALEHEAPEGLKRVSPNNRVT